ncbi:unnamed protein product [Vitrella brassicaformis CCMP3155]|uniref:Protein YIPF n=1 Tax=Vitrella brassicaformis (strain CCMP3155) TaxID=1169540 RepID=A0A0G4GN99_VITBC|nr:unnamed protein product [Vitrella brassicaformis CCMP3155]|eukprot:CEM31672.1 unnamed protein product [Vitrella brassicaformis CCMP3155]
MSTEGLPPNWTMYMTDDGKPYYHNAVTNVTTWDKPAMETEAHQPPGSSRGGAGALNSGDVYQVNFEDLDLNSQSRPLTGSLDGPATGASRGGMMDMSKGAQKPSQQTAIEGRMDSFTSEPGGRSEAPTVSLTGGRDVRALRCCPDLAWMQQFFDVTTADVVKRIMLATVPFKSVSSGGESDFRTNPDFYGPFWIATTVIIFLAATGNYALFIEQKMKSTDFVFFTVAATVVYGFLFGVPLVSRLLLYFTGSGSDSINFRQLICVYGYSLFVFIPVSLICIAPLEWLKWVAVSVGMAISISFICINLYTDLTVSLPRFRYLLMGLLCAAQATLFLTYRLYFLTAHTHGKR